MDEFIQHCVDNDVNYVLNNKKFYEYDGIISLLRHMHNFGDDVCNIILKSCYGGYQYCDKCVILHIIRNNDIKLFKKICDLNINFYTKHLACILFCNNDELMNYFFTKYDNIQEIFESVNYESEFFDNHGNWAKPNEEKLKRIMSYGININNKIDEILIFAAKKKLIDVVKVCCDNGANKINMVLKLSVGNNNYEITEYLLSIGATTNLIDKYDLAHIDYKIFKLLLDTNYNFSEDDLGMILVNCLQNNLDMDTIYKMYSYVNNFDYLFKIEQNQGKPNTKTFYFLTWCDDLYPSYLEIFICDNYVDHIKMIIKHDPENIKKEINRLFASAISNNGIEIAQCLLDLDVNIDYSLALKVACYYGHIESFKFVLKYCNESMLNSELYNYCVYGMNCEYDYIKIKKILNIWDNNFGWEHIEIVHYLMKQNILIPTSFIKILSKEYYDKYLFEHLLLNHDATFLLKYCIHNNDLENAKYLLDNGGMFDPNLIKNENMRNLVQSYL